MIKIVEFSSGNQELLEAVTRLRASVWNSHLKCKVFGDNRWTDVHDVHAFHWGVFNDRENLIASARMCVHETIEEFPDFFPGNRFAQAFNSPIAMMNRLVVHSDYNRQGISKRLDRARIEKAISLNCRNIVVEVPSYRRSYLESLGFEYISEMVDITNIKESKMKFYFYRKVLNVQV